MNTTFPAKAIDPQYYPIPIASENLVTASLMFACGACLLLTTGPDFSLELCQVPNHRERSVVIVRWPSIVPSKEEHGFNCRAANLRKLELSLVSCGYIPRGPDKSLVLIPRIVGILFL